MDKKRTERTTRESFLGIPGTEYWVTKLSDNNDRKSEGFGRTKNESIENAYKDWREKYK